jgi:YD repeat-containing protein
MVERAEGRPVNVVTTTYDANGNISGMYDNNPGFAANYDSRNRLIQLNDAVGGLTPDIVLNYTYDPNGNRTSMSDNQGARSITPTTRSTS